MELSNLKQGDELVLKDDVTLQAWIYNEADQRFFDGFVRVVRGSVFLVKANWESYAIGQELPLTLELPQDQYMNSQLDYYCGGNSGCLVMDVTIEELQKILKHFVAAPILSNQPMGC